MVAQETNINTSHVDWALSECIHILSNNFHYLYANLFIHVNVDIYNLGHLSPLGVALHWSIKRRLTIICELNLQSRSRVLLSKLPC